MKIERALVAYRAATMPTCACGDELIPEDGEQCIGCAAADEA